MEETSFYHSNHALTWLQDRSPAPGVMGWYREWRQAWSDDQGDLLP